MAIVGVGILAGLLSGFYPALVLSGFRPALTLRANSSGQGGSGRLRTGLVVLQFAVSIGLGIGALVVFQQIEFARNIDLGFRRDNIVFTGTAGRLTEDGVKSFVQALQRGPGVLQVARTSFMPFNGNNYVLPVQRPGDAAVSFAQPYLGVTGLFPTFSTSICWPAARFRTIAKRTISTKAPNGDQGKNEGHNVMVNASLARALGYAPADIVGKSFVFGKSHRRVVGVVADTLVGRSALARAADGVCPQGHNLQNIVIRIAPGRTAGSNGLYRAHCTQPLCMVPRCRAPC